MVTVGRAGKLVLVALAALSPTVARAEGEHTPMFGGSVVGASGHADDLAGGQLEAAWWRWRLGLSAEGSMLWGFENRRETALGFTARVLVFDTLVGSLLEPSDVELGIELQGIVERVWWAAPNGHDDATRYGVGAALRLRGATDIEMSNVITESRVFVRVMATPLQYDPAIARTIGPPEPRAASDVMVVIGLGASFGTGEPDYIERFRMVPFSRAARQLARGWFE